MNGELKFGAILQACRERAGISQEAMAEILNRTRSSVSKLENDKQVIGMPTFYKWMEATGRPEVVVAYLYGIDGLQMINHLKQEELAK